ncbi:uncharacterized protein M6B38_364645 [Iris pallida]|uniref:LITAF domain-containing protein n=1 Tax=Iris pallida TaxID=29817 RepID=A0AAX6GIA5_IRIPA|nr:uncharacterized protein M6B38_364645 [Iris pallida]
MGTREVYEEKLRSGNLHHDPTINPGLGSARCPRCLSLLNPNSNNAQWTITSVLHDFTEVVGAGAGGMLSAVHGFNTGIQLVSVCSEACEGAQVAAIRCGGSSTAIVFWSQCCTWSICSPKVCTTLSDIILCCFQCIPLCNITGYPVC